MYPVQVGQVRALGRVIPVYRGGVVPGTVAARQAAFVEWIGCLISPQAILSDALSGHADVAVELLRSRNAGTSVVPLSFKMGRIAPGAMSVTVDLNDGTTVQTFGDVAGTGVFVHANAAAALLAGTLASLLVAALIFVLATSRARALRMVRARTRTLSQRAARQARIIQT